jgi:glycosyltransferase involved in cell wall biosynthesis
MALRAQDLAEPFEVIVVDDGSVDDTCVIAEAHAPFVKLVRSGRREGPGAARNRGVQIARAPVLAFTDADCFPTPLWLERGLAAAARADLVQGAVMPDPETARRPFDRTLLVEHVTGFYQTANLLVRREVFDAVGGFTDWSLDRPSLRRRETRHRRSLPKRTPPGEDALFAWTARRMGASGRFAGDALVHHAVFVDGLWGEVADRWHWTRDMPGLARFVPELRGTTFYRHWFFSVRTMRFDLAVAGVLAAALSRRKGWLLLAYPYARWLLGDVRRWGPAQGARFALGAPVSDAVALAGLLVGSAVWRSLVL